MACQEWSATRLQLAQRTLRYIHRRIGDADVYFVANGTNQRFATTCSFRVTGKQPELWHPETGLVVDLPFYQEQDGCTNVLLQFGPTESMFVVFRRPGQLAEQLVAVRRDGHDLMRLDAPGISLDLAKTEPAPAAGGDEIVLDLARSEIWQPGTYALQTADGRSP